MPTVSRFTPGPDLPPVHLDLSKIRHDLRTPINHIVGYCEMLQEEEQTPEDFQPDLQKIRAGGKQLLSLITEYFDEETFESKAHDLHQLCHELRTPVNHIVGYAELLGEMAEERGLRAFFSDLDKIRAAAQIWLELMEEYLVFPQVDSTRKALASELPLHATLLHPGIGFSAPLPRNTFVKLPQGSHLLVVDDDAANRDMLSRRLVRFGCKVSVASSGLEALRLLRSEPFDLVLLDLVMPGLDGYQVLSKIKSDPLLAEVPVVMISALDQDSSVARCIEAGAEDYVPKPFNSVLLRARIGACLERKGLRDQERRTFKALEKSQKILRGELAEAAAYVLSLLPPPLDAGLVRTAWKYLPSTQLGGDALGYHAVDEGRVAVYVLDVCGHGVGAALLSVSVMNVLRNRSVSGVDFADPAAVLTALNQTFQMDRQNQMFFTVWYGVLDTRSGKLTFASGGHPPAVLLDPTESAPVLLSAPGAVIGGFPEAQYTNGERTLTAGSRLYVFSDGVYELERTDGSTVRLDEFVEELRRPAAGSKLDAVLAWAKAARNQQPFEDDISIVEVSVQ